MFAHLRAALCKYRGEVSENAERNCSVRCPFGHSKSNIGILGLLRLECSSCTALRSLEPLSGAKLGCREPPGIA